MQAARSAVEPVPCRLNGLRSASRCRNKAGLLPERTPIPEFCRFAAARANPAAFGGHALRLPVAGNGFVAEYTVAAEGGRVGAKPAPPAQRAGHAPQCGRLQSASFQALTASNPS
ncbi:MULTISPECIES: hypothetical protein [unclassified Neisseria]|uniref:hypothetical protein n=1 Tax=unclassified Neisseria TaxID=2623750 RepID=UPI0010715EFB|nr:MULTISPECIES: hypothetical protein [unclassified Neisseria]MBF0804369.1 hypothetical protein [Neisseria sp. 19428wB4_WF04]TFU42850.1 hypothetical protein E4T99_08455 [Neisseria sp. WF04]